MNIKMLRTLATASRNAYWDYPKLFGYSPRFLSDSRAQATVFHNEENVILAFRGSQAEDVGTDLRFRREGMTVLPGTWHRGFKYQLMDLYHQAVAAIRPHVYAGKKLYITGHSLGGALAVLFTARAFALDAGVLSTYKGTVTYGAPRVANRKASKWLDEVLGEHLLRVEIIQDRVPHLPPAALGYRHAGKAILLDAVEAKILSPRRKWYGRWSLALALLRKVKAHKSANYVRILEEFVGATLRRVLKNASGKS
jgi:hypothetical protein